MQTIEDILEYIKREGTNVQKFSKETGISADRVYSWRAGRGKPKGEDTKKLLDWANKIGSNAETDLEKFKQDEEKDRGISEETALQAIIKIADANKLLAQSNKDLTDMLKAERVASPIRDMQTVQDINEITMRMKAMETSLNALVKTVSKMLTTPQQQPV